MVYMCACVCVCIIRALTLKACVPERLAAEALVILHSIDDDGPSQNVCKNKNVGLLQAGSRLQRVKRDIVKEQCFIVLLCCNIL